MGWLAESVLLRSASFAERAGLSPASVLICPSQPLPEFSIWQMNFLVRVSVLFTKNQYVGGDCVIWEGRISVCSVLETYRQLPYFEQFIYFARKGELYTDVQFSCDRGIFRGA